MFLLESLANKVLQLSCMEIFGRTDVGEETELGVQEGLSIKKGSTAPHSSSMVLACSTRICSRRKGLQGLVNPCKGKVKRLPGLTMAMLLVMGEKVAQGAMHGHRQRRWKASCRF